MDWPRFFRISFRFGFTGYENKRPPKDKGSSLDSGRGMERGRDQEKDSGQSDSKGDK